MDNLFELKKLELEKQKRTQDWYITRKEKAEQDHTQALHEIEILQLKMKDLTQKETKLNRLSLTYLIAIINGDCQRQLSGIEKEKRKTWLGLKKNKKIIATSRETISQAKIEINKYGDVEKRLQNYIKKETDRILATSQGKIPTLVNVKQQLRKKEYLLLQYEHAMTSGVKLLDFLKLLKDDLKSTIGYSSSDNYVLTHIEFNKNQDKYEEMMLMFEQYQQDIVDTRKCFDYSPLFLDNLLTPTNLFTDILMSGGMMHLEIQKLKGHLDEILLNVSEMQNELDSHQSKTKKEVKEIAEEMNAILEDNK